MTMPTDWWRDFFSGLAVEFWHAFPTPAWTAAEVDRLLAAMQPAASARLLDVPCGNGRHARELAARGFLVTGVDGSTALLALATPTANVELLQRDMRDLPWPQRFDGACCLGNSFGYLGDDGDAAFAAAVHRALRPGGTFVLEPTVLETLLPQLTPRRWYEASGIHFLSEVHYDPVHGVLRSDYRFVRGDVTERKSAWLRVRSLRETIELLRAAGFARVDALGAGLQPFAQGSPQLLLRAVA